MKTELLKEEADRLIQLGVSTDEASIFKIKSVSSIFIGETAYYPPNVPITAVKHDYTFNLIDMLKGKILPLETGMPGDPDHKVRLRMYFEDGNWHAEYPGLKEFEAPELIDALYQLAVWYYEIYETHKI